MDIHGKPIAERIDWLFGLADRHSIIFRSPEAWLARERYLAEHPTAIAVLKCMDGRINIPVATNTPVGLLMPFRNLGGIFDLGWPHLGEVLAHHVQRVVGAGRHVLFLVTYHYSQGDPRRGCAGFQYGLDFDNKPRVGDFEMSFSGLKVYVDPISAMHLEGTTIDYVMGISGAGFKFNNPNAKSTCGCGSSFS